LLQEIARGGMGVVYKARQPALNRTVALKMILGGRLTSRDAVERFRTEARAAAALDHPNIVPIFDAGQCGDQHYFTMAFVEGRNLDALVEAEGVRSPAEAAAVVRAVAEAVEYAHRRGIVHRDLKPANVLIDAEGRPRVTDFGLAKSLEEGIAMTAPGQVLGTPSFMAPEQAQGRSQEVGKPADIFALGGILYYLLTGRAPFTGDSVAEVLRKAAFESPPAPRSHRPDLPEGLEAICMKCMHKDPARRYATAGEVAAALLPCVTPTVVSAAPATARGPGRRLWVAAAGVAALLVAAGLWATRHRPEEKGPAAGSAPDRPVAENPQPEAPRGADPAQEPPRRDFGLAVEMLGADPGAAGARQLVEGKHVRFRIAVGRDAYVGIWDEAPDGPVTQIFPNEYEPDNLLRAGKPQEIPGAGRRYNIDAELSQGINRVRVVASSRPWDPLRGELQGQFLLFKTKDQKEGWNRRLREIRGLRVRPAGPQEPVAVSEETLQYQVVPAPKPGRP
jgi:tRNA A-37 threonylcarbamoyl transferase component Bud32